MYWKGKIMKNILPINLNPKITSECWTYLRSAIIDAYPHLINWYVNHLDILYINDNFDVNYGEYGDKYQVLQHYESVLNSYTRNILDLTYDNIIDFIIEQINNDKYIMIDCDLSKSININIGQILIYGYDMEEQIFYIAGIGTGCSTYLMKVIAEAFLVRKVIDLKELEKTIFNRQVIYPISIFEVRKDCNIEPDLNLFLNHLKRQLSRIKYDKNCENFNSSFREGICSVYDGFLEMLVKIKNGTFDVTTMIHSFPYNFNKLIEFHNVFKWRLEYLNNLYSLNINNNVYSKLDLTIKELEICKSLASKYLETRNNNNIDKIQNYLISILLKEENLISNLIQKISKNILYGFESYFYNNYEMKINKKIKKIIQCPILLYHHFVNEETANMENRTTAMKFEEDISILIEHGYKSISLEDFYKYEIGVKELPEKPFIITIDDGYLSNYEIAFPILKKYNVYAEIFIVTDFIGLNTHPDFPNLIPHFSNGQAIEMEQSGLIKIHSHGKWHKPNAYMSYEEFSININDSTQSINNIKLDKNFVCYAYPEGIFNDYTIDMINKEGYKYQLINKNDLTISNLNKGCLGRICVNHKSDVYSLIKDYNVYINNFINKLYKSETLILSNDILSKYKNLSTILDECQFKYKNKYDYNIKSIKYDGIDITCNEDELIIYSCKKALKETQSDNYEIIIDKDNKIIGDNISGDTVIPQGGYVLSSNGRACKTLKSMYIPNADVFICKSENKILILETPKLRIHNTFLSFENIKDKFEISKNKYFYFNYQEIQNKIDELQIIVNDCKSSLEINENETSLQLSKVINDQIENIEYMLIPNKVIENRAVWYRSNEKSDIAVRKVIEKVSSLNINCIYLETWYDGKFIGYSDNPLIEHQEWHNSNFDALEAFCRIGHEYNIEIHAWVENFFIGTVESALVNKNNLINKMEDRYLLDKNNNYYNQTVYGKYVFLNPYDNYCRDFLLDLYKEILLKYSVDGIHLDYIRFPDLNYGKYDYGYNKDIIRGFQYKYNTYVDVRSLNESDEMHKEWCKFREDIINSFVEEVHNLVKRVNHNKWISCACYSNVDIAPKTIFQNLSEWVKNGWIDEAFSMSYAENCSYVEKSADSFIKICKDNVFYSIGLKAFDDIPELDVLNQIKTSRNKNTNGISLFALNYIDNYEHILKKGVFKQKSVQAYKTDKIITVGINDILIKISNANSYLNLSGTNCLENIRNHCLALITKTEMLDFSKFNNDDKVTYVNDCINDIKLIIETIDAYTINKTLEISLKEDFLILLSLLNKNKNRLVSNMSK